MIVKSGALKDCAVVMDLKDDQRGLVWIEGRFSHVLGPGLYAYSHGVRDVRVEVINARQVRLEHNDLKVIAKSATAKSLVDICTVDRDRVGVLFIDGRYIVTLAPGLAHNAFPRRPGGRLNHHKRCIEATLSPNRIGKHLVDHGHYVASI